jgi:hypothetical protein
MSIAEFSEALKSTALKSWFQRLSTDNILKMSTQDIRKKESGKEFNSFYITEKTVSDIIEKLSGAKADPVKVTAVFSKLSKTSYDNKARIAKLLSEPYVEGSALYFPRISFDGISKLLDVGFESVLDDAKKSDPSIKISDYFQRGHVFGIFPKKLAETRKSLEKNTTLTDQARALLVGYLSDLEKELEEEDLATSNLKTPSFELYAKYKKKPSSYLVEMQLKETNESAGRAQAPLAKAVSKYFDTGKVTFTSGGIKFTAGAAEQKIKSLMEAQVEKLIGTKGSPSFVDLIVADISAKIISDKPGKLIEYKTGLVPIIKSKAAKINTSAINAKIKKDKVAIKKLKASVKAVPKFETHTPQLNLSNLQNLLNQRLHDAIKANMGTGSDKRVLNYRSGRLASSAKVERMSEGRQGMITAFYTYMKNPYATFSEGGIQSSPRSRDPKLLIAKSIRDIAGTQVANRLRSINV